MTVSKKAHDELRIDNLIYKLNHIANQRQELYDQLWAIEENAIQIRVELIKLISEREKC